jgi:hypothetical protein
MIENEALRDRIEINCWFIQEYRGGTMEHA